jgi:hypothetical protein
MKMIKYQGGKMNLKKTAMVFIALLIALFGCASTPAGNDDLDIAIRDTSDYLNENIPKGNKIVILNIQSDYAALSIGKFLGAQTIVSGAISELAGRHRMRIRALNVQTAEVQGQYNYNINASRLIAVLMKGGRSTTASYGTKTANAKRR